MHDGPNNTTNNNVVPVTLVSVYNAGCLSLAQNLLTSLARQNLLQHHVSFVTDDASVTALAQSHPSARVERFVDVDDVVHADNESSSRPTAVFATKRFNRLSFLRYQVIADLLRADRRGHRFIWYLDVDTVVLGDLLQYFVHTLLAATAAASVDLYLQDDLNMACTGCMLFRPSAGALALAECMVKNRRDDENDQIVLDRVLRLCRGDGRLRVALLDLRLFPNGLLFFGAAPESHATFSHKIAEFHGGGGGGEEGEQCSPLFVHANWMVGLESKRKALESRQLWFSLEKGE